MVDFEKHIGGLLRISLFTKGTNMSITKVAACWTESAYPSEISAITHVFGGIWVAQS